LLLALLLLLSELLLLELLLLSELRLLLEGEVSALVRRVLQTRVDVIWLNGRCCRRGWWYGRWGRRCSKWRCSKSCSSGWSFAESVQMRMGFEHLQFAKDALMGVLQ
jgi:hypothetical protein